MLYIFGILLQYMCDSRLGPFANVDAFQIIKVSVLERI